LTASEAVECGAHDPPAAILNTSEESRKSGFAKAAGRILRYGPVRMVLSSLDSKQRYKHVRTSLKGTFVLDVGAGGQSMLSIFPNGRRILSLDLKVARGVDVAASAANLPFQSRCFDTVISVDTLEHVDESLRSLVICELKRVAKRRVVIHCPLEDGSTYRGRYYDLLFFKWQCAAKGEVDGATREHVANAPISARFLSDEGFLTTGTMNCMVWFSCMKLQALSPLMGLFVATVYFALSSKRNSAPFWGGLSVYTRGA